MCLAHCENPCYNRLMEFVQLKQLVVIAEEKVLSHGAERLNISQPALSRSIQRLEDELGLPLFDRTKNSMVLNEAGAAIVEEAKKVLSDADALLKKAHALKNEEKHIRIVTCAPAPLWKLSAELGAAFPKIKITSSMPDEDSIISLLLSEKADLAIVRKEIESEAISTLPLTDEQLCMRIPLTDELSKKKSIKFADLAGKEIREYTKTGFWHKVHRDLIPGAVYIEYDDIMVYTNVINSQNPLTFVTELANTHAQNPAGAVTVPITDEEACAHYRLAFLKKNEEALRGIVDFSVKSAMDW